MKKVGMASMYLLLAYLTYLIVIAGPLTFILGRRYEMVFSEMARARWHKNVGGPIFFSVFLLFWLPFVVHCIKQKLLRKYSVCFILVLPIIGLAQGIGCFITGCPIFGEGQELALLLVIGAFPLYLMKRYLSPKENAALRSPQ